MRAALFQGQCVVELEVAKRLHAKTIKDLEQAIKDEHKRYADAKTTIVTQVLYIAQHAPGTPP